MPASVGNITAYLDIKPSPAMPESVEFARLRDLCRLLDIPTRNVCGVQFTTRELVIERYVVDDEGHKIVHRGELAKIRTTIPVCMDDEVQS
jgi:hypothetical protein